MAQDNPVDTVRRISMLSVLWGVLLIVLGVLAIAVPMTAAVAVNVVVSWLFVVAGITYLGVAFHRHEAGSIIWRALIGLAYIAFGIYLVVHPAIGVVSLTLVIASLFLVEGIFDIALFFQVRAIRGAGWVLFDGIVTLALGLLIYLQWPSSSAWAIGTLVGASLMVSGITRLVLAAAVHKVATDIMPRAA